ncbi:DUF1002 domain-containing protein [Fictibacillus iocasae]|uniref:DUF1002 domain-containing protein n=1 Tax=Fictibacillus iocasae TaxID=2715437 RepID=A0ABW2NLS6_9BACL
MKALKSFSLLLLLAGVFMASPFKASADAAPGDVIVTLGENLTEEQKTTILKEMEVDPSVQTVSVSNEEEHQYLGDYMSKAQIGTRAISSAKITIAEEGAGLSVKTNNINHVTEEMYMNALTTAGVKDADILVTAPFDVSGTAALTGILKAYETTAQIEIPEKQKQVANEEMVKTAELGDRIGAEKASELMTKVKEEISQDPSISEAELKTLIQNTAKDLGIELTEEELNGLTSLFNRMKDLNIDWDQVQTQLKDIKDNLGEILNSEETKSFLQKVLDFFIAIIEAIKNLFK